MKILFLGGIKDGSRLELDEEVLSLEFSHSSKDAKYEKVEIVVSIDGTSISVDVMVAEDLPHMQAIDKFLTYK